MIEFEKKIRIYSYQLQDIYCCDCFFDGIARKLFSDEDFDSCDEFIKSLEEKFPDEEFVIKVFSGSILLVCNAMFKFVIDNKGKFELMRKSCIPDCFNLGEIEILACLVCVIGIVKETVTLKKFKLKGALRNYFLYM